MMKKKSHATNFFNLRDLEPRDNRSSRFKVMSQKVGWLFEDHFWRGSQFQKFWSPDFGHKMDETSGFYGSNQKTIHANHQIKWQNEDFLIASDIVRIILEILVIFTLTTAQFYKKKCWSIFHQKWHVNTYIHHTPTSQKHFMGTRKCKIIEYIYLTYYHENNGIMKWPHSFFSPLQW